MTSIISDCGTWKIFGNYGAKYLIAGHSHTFCMYQAIERNKSLSENFAVVVQSDFSNIERQSESYWKFVKSFEKEKKILISWNGNQHNIHFLIDSGQEFNTVDFFSGDNLPIVPLKQIRELFKPTFLELKQVLNSFSAKSNLVLLGTPPPKNYLFLNSRIHSEKFFVDLAREMGVNLKNLSVSSDSLRAYMWKFTQQLTFEVAQEQNLKFISVPKHTYDENLMLKDIYYADDLTHANDRFGVEMLENIEINLQNLK